MLDAPWLTMGRCAYIARRIFFLVLCIQVSDVFLNTFPFFRAPIGQGYGLTETFAGATFSEFDDTTVGRVGPPLPCCYIKVCLYLLMKFFYRIM